MTSLRHRAEHGAESPHKTSAKRFQGWLNVPDHHQQQATGRGSGAEDLPLAP